MSVVIRKVLQEEVAELKVLSEDTFRETFAHDNTEAQLQGYFDTALSEEVLLDEITHEDMVKNIGLLQNIYDKITELNHKNNLLKAKYENDAKYARMHKRILEKGNISKRESEICDTLMDIKKQVDEKILINTQMLNNESYFDKL